MTENKRYFSIDYDEEYYIFDSTKISKEEVLEKAEYSYDVFGDSLMEDDIVNLLNENEQLKKENKHLRCTIESNSQDDYIDYLKKQNERLKERITELETEIQPIRDICKKYQIPIQDLPAVLEEYIATDNEEYQEKLRSQ